MPPFQDSINLPCKIKTTIFQSTKTMEMNSQGQRIPSKFVLTATWGDVLLDAADFHPVTGCLKGPTTSGSAEHYQACHSGEK